MDKQIVVISDLHYEHLTEETEKNLLEEFLSEIAPELYSAIILTGDISNSTNFDELLRKFRTATDIRVPIYFVLGNHDFYGGDYYNTIKKAKSVVNTNTEEGQLIYLTDVDESIRLNNPDADNTTYLIGVDGWGDMNNGIIRTGIARRINDFHQIQDFSYTSDVETHARIANNIGYDNAHKLRKQLDDAILKNEARRIFVATHVPPFPEVAYYDGKPTEEDWLPYFTCKHTGDVLIEAARRYHWVKFVVVCGHTHNQAKKVILPNLTATCIGAEYGKVAFTQLPVRIS